MTPTDLRQNFLPVKSVGLPYTHFRNHLPLFMRLPGPKNPKNCQNLRRVAKVGLMAAPDRSQWPDVQRNELGDHTIREERGTWRPPREGFGAICYDALQLRE